MDPLEPVPIYTTYEAAQAEIIKNALQAEGINCQIEGENQGGFAGALLIRLLVPAKDAVQARAILEAHEPEPRREE